ncbi:MAG: DUF2815 family protein [Prevotella sp.]|nr:DUF2815 family protein [Prevotella sp.]
MAITETTFTTGRARLSFTHLFEPYANNPGQEAKYSVTVLVPKSDVAAKQRLDAAEAAAKRQGLAKCWNGAMPPMIASAVHDGDGVRPNGEPFGEECRGCWVFTASSKQPPQVVDVNLNPIINQSDVYSGCYARVCVNFFPYNSNGKRGVGIGLQAVQKIEDGEPLGGRVSAAEAFGAPMAVSQPAQQAQMYAPQYDVYSGQNAPVQQPIDPLTGLPYENLPF